MCVRVCVCELPYADATDSATHLGCSELEVFGYTVYMLLQHARFQREEGPATSVHAALPHCHGRFSIDGACRLQRILGGHALSSPEVRRERVPTWQHQHWSQKQDDCKVSSRVGTSFKPCRECA